MASHVYQFKSVWRVEGTAEDVYAIMDDALSLPRWWPSVYLDVQVIPGQTSPLGGKVYSLYTKGWLPYTLRWRFYRTEQIPPRRLALQAFGDFVGRGTWTFEQDGTHVNVTFDWSISAEKPLLKHLSFVFKPIFALNHGWAMARGQESLQLELKRRATPEAERSTIPPPPGPSSSIPLWIGAALTAGIVAGGVYLLLR